MKVWASFTWFWVCWIDLNCLVSDWCLNRFSWEFWDVPLYWIKCTFCVQAFWKDSQILDDDHGEDDDHYHDDHGDHGKTATATTTTTTKATAMFSSTCMFSASPPAVDLWQWRWAQNTDGNTRAVDVHQMAIIWSHLQILHKMSDKENQIKWNFQKDALDTWIFKHLLVSNKTLQMLQ